MIPDEETTRKLKEWAEKHGLFLRITNDQHHWSFYKEGKVFFEWWPSTGKMVANKEWEKSKRIRDTAHLMAVMTPTILEAAKKG